MRESLVVTLCSQLFADFNRSKIIDEAKSRTLNEGYALAYFYCNYKEEKRRDPASILRSVVKQLCLMSPGDGSGFPDPVLSIYNKRKHDGDLSNHLSVEESRNLLIALSAGFLCTTIVIDALDECDASTRGSLFDVLDDIMSSKGNAVKAFVTSRDDGDLRRKFEDRPNVFIQERDNLGDINHYIKTEIVDCISQKKLLGGNVSAELQGRIIEALQAGARGMYVAFVVNFASRGLCIDSSGIQVHMGQTPNHENLL